MVFFSTALFAGMLFWAKLRVIHDIPKSAYAVPGAGVSTDVEVQDGTADGDADSQGDAEVRNSRAIDGVADGERHPPE